MRDDNLPPGHPWDESSGIVCVATSPMRSRSIERPIRRAHDGFRRKFSPVCVDAVILDRLRQEEVTGFSFYNIARPNIPPDPVIDDGSKILLPPERSRSTRTFTRLRRIVFDCGQTLRPSPQRGVYGRQKCRYC
jgi:hypothetical protein